MKLIIGLGNTGPKYLSTRHNVGFLAVQWLAEKWQIDGWSSRTKLQSMVTSDSTRQIILAQPSTMMNESGQAVRALMDYYQLRPADITVIHDDADLEVGDIRTVNSTTTGAGHHGVLSIIQHIGGGFKRIRIGIGRPDQPQRDISDYVLGRLGVADKQTLIESFASHLEDLLAD